MSKTYEGKKHDKKICDEQNFEFPDGIELFQDLGYVGNAPENVVVKMPIKKPKGGELTDDQKEYNKKISSERILIEHVIRGVKIFRIVGDKFRSWKKRWRDLVMILACGLYNFRIGCRLENANYST